MIKKQVEFIFKGPFYLPRNIKMMLCSHAFFFFISQDSLVNGKTPTKDKRDGKQAGVT
jgi:hypothetical protein